MNKEEFIKELSKLNINITAKQLNDLNTYYQILVDENKKYNLTNITNEQDVYLKHFYDSLTMVKAIELNNQNLIDIGTGAGFPGLVLKIIFPNLKVTLLDATNKKCHFLNLVITALDLQDINVINARCEEYSHQVREYYDIVVSRAVAPLKHLLEYGIPLLKINGIFVALKSNLENEIININHYHQVLNLTNESIINFTLPFEESKRTIYKITKIKETNKKYPRKYTLIKKKEL